VFLRHAAKRSVLAFVEKPVYEYKRLRQITLLIEGELRGGFPPVWSTDLPTVEVTAGNHLHKVEETSGTRVVFPRLVRQLPISGLFGE